LRNFSVGKKFMVLLAVIALNVRVEGSVHEYKDASFKESGDAYLLYGGNEGMRASIDSDQKHGSGPNNGKSYIK
jgi:hypothetical protein